MTHLQVEGGSGSYWPIWAAALCAIGLVVGFTWWNQSLIEAQTVRDLGDTLTTVLDTTSGAVHHWIREREGEIQIWAEHSDIRQLSGELVEAGALPEMLPEQPAQTHLREQMSGLLHEGRVEGFLVVTLEGLVVAADRNGDLGKEAPQLMPPALLSQVLDGPRHTAFSLPDRSGNDDQRAEGHGVSMHVATLLRDKEGADLAVLVFRIDPEKDFTEILQRGRLGVSGESYAFNSEGQLISESRFEDDLRGIGLIPPGERGILNVDIRDPGGNLVQGHSPKTAREDQSLTLMARTAISGQSGVNLDGYNDYRGVPVIGAWTWDHGQALGITTEIDVAEAYESLRRARWLTVTGTGLTVLLIVVLTGIFIRSRRMIGVSLASLQRANEELQSMSSAILRWAPDGTVLHLNKFGQDLFGFTEEELVGKPLLGTLVPDTETTGRSLKQMITKICSDPSEYEINENENSCKDGRRIWMAWRNKPILNRDKSLREILTVGIDITERKEAELKLEAVSESAADAIVLGDTSDTVIGWNGAAETILGWSRDEILGRSLQTLIPERYRAAHRAGIDRISQTGEGRVLGKTMELTALHREGHEVEIELSLSTWRVASERFYTGIIRDITERKKMEAALQRSYDTVAAAHARMKKDLDAAARVQQSLLPASIPESDRVRIAWQYHPCDELAGDSLNVLSLGPRHVAFYIVDVSGHGVPAALLSVSVNRSLEPSADASSLVTGPGNAVTSPAEVAQRLNTLYSMQDWDDYYFTMVYGVLDLESGRFRFITAGHPGPILVRPGEPPKQIEARSLAIGFFEAAAFSDSEVQLAAGDRLYMFSDGLYEEMNDAGEQFEISRLMEALTSRVDEPLDASLEFVRQDLIAWHGEESFTDDLSILAVEMLGT